MRAADLDIHELLHFVREGGRITFAGERVLLLDAAALGLLRKELIETLGATAARAVPHQIRLRTRMARRRNASEGISLGQRGRLARRGSAPAHDTGSRARGGDACFAQS